MVRFAAIKKYTQNPTLISINLRLSQIKQHLQWRVWSWLRMNASGRLNTCKSWGSAGSNTGRRPANGCGTRTQPSFKWGI